MRRSRWRAGLLGRLDPVLRSWLTEPDSLTIRCQQACREDFRVRLLRYDHGQPLADEAAGCARGRQPVWVREVVLECDGRPVIFAHTTLAITAKGCLPRWMAGLGNRSLGSLLFSFPGFRREAIEYLRLDRRHPLYQRAAAVGQAGATLWARRSLHRLGSECVLVTEVFLPEISRLK